MSRIYYPRQVSSQKSIQITSKDELHHMYNVLRLKTNSPVEVFNGRGHEARGKIISINSTQAQIQLSSVKKKKTKLPQIILACALPKRGKFETIIEKATELGVDIIIPLKTKRTEVKIKNDQMAKKQIRFETVAKNAAKQCQRATVPAIEPVSPLQNVVKRLLSSSDCIVPSLTSKTSKLEDTFKKLKSPKQIAIFIGPEGDFTKEEYAFMHKSGCHAVSLGKHVLKVETAALCALSCCLIHFHS